MILLSARLEKLSGLGLCGITLATAPDQKATDGKSRWTAVFKEKEERA